MAPFFVLEKENKGFRISSCNTSGKFEQALILSGKYFLPLCALLMRLTQTKAHLHYYGKKQNFSNKVVSHNRGFTLDEHYLLVSLSWMGREV